MTSGTVRPPFGAPCWAPHFRRIRITLYDLDLTCHIASGTLALAAFWSTAALRKGTRLHRRVGGAYVAGMLGVMLTALPLAFRAFAAHHPASGAFFLYLVVITGSALWTAWRAIRCRAAIAAFLGGGYRAVAWANIASGAAILGMGLYSNAAVLDGMSSVGLIVGWLMLKFHGRPDTSRQWWVKRHYRGMVASGIASHVAFLNIGLQHIVPHGLADAARYAAWFGPLIVATLAIVWLDRRYRGGTAAVPRRAHARCARR